MNLRTLWLAVALGASPLVAHAQISAEASFSWSSAPPAEAVDSVDVFYDQLSPYGVWIDDPVVGQAFIPDQSNFVPYTNGHWENTDVGFVWISDEPFSWATSHYGRWWFSNDYGRWVWVPDTTWGPSWVDWYDAGGDLGWAPLAPQVVIDDGYQMPYTAYHYAPAEHILDPNVTRYYEPRDRVEVIQRQAQPITHRANIGSHDVIAGPAPERLAAHHVRAEVKHIAPKQMGRMSAAEVRTVEQRAQQRKPQIEQQNARRLQAHTELQKVVQQRSTKAPARPGSSAPAATPRDRDRTPEPNRTAPTRPEATRPELNRAEPNRVEPNRAEPNRVEPNRAEPNRVEPNRAEPNRAPARPNVDRSPHQQPPRAEPARPDAERAVRPEPQRAEPPRPEPQRAEPSRPEPQRAEPPRPEPQRTEPPRAEPHPAPHGEARGHDKADDKRHP